MEIGGDSAVDAEDSLADNGRDREASENLTKLRKTFKPNGANRVFL
jgi:hypothetical protein